MHELSIAEALLDVSLRHANGRRVERVEVTVGHLRQVVPDALQFAWGLITEGTAADGAELVLEEVPAAGRCRSCNAQTPLPAFPLTCGSCGGFDVDVTRGEELRVEALELDDELAMSTRGG
jgi:hydrogenase nickel incorporation protein HypA/HybF